MGYSPLMHIIQTLDQLSEIKSWNCFRELSSGSDIIKQFPTSGQLEDNVDHILIFTILFFDLPIFAVFDEIDDIGVTQLAHCMDFSHDKF